MNIPANLYYTKEHEWLKVEGKRVSVGITDYAQDAIGDIVYVELPAVGDELKAGDVLAEIESVKATSDVYAPVSGRVVEVTEALEESPELINEDAYANPIAIIEVQDVNLAEFLTADQYKALLEQEG